MDCAPDSSSWYWAVIIGLVLINWWLFGKWKDSERLVPDFYDDGRSSRGPNYVGDEKEDEVSKHRKRQKRREKIEKAREEREKRISAVPLTVTVTRSADGQVTTTVDPEGREGSKIPYAPSKMTDAASRLNPPEEISWEQDDSIGLVPVDEDEEAQEL